MITEEIIAEAMALVETCRERRLVLATAESCTGGMIAAALTAIAGSSQVLDRGFVTYSNRAKTEMLDVPPGLIASVGAVSEAVAARMAAGALHRSRAHLAVSVTGIAGPTGGSAEKPVGTVWFGLARRGGDLRTGMRRFDGDRTEVRQAATRHALHLFSQAAES